jgi:class 3 adenylate cyclase
VVGREFPITKGIAGWVYKTQQPYFRNRAKDDPHHFDRIDKAAETQSGEGAILTVPLVIGGRCYGVIQFMKSRQEGFTEEDVAIATRWAPRLTRLLMELEENPQEDVPSIARGNIIVASILFSDISNFSRVVSSIRMDAAVALLNEYYTRLLPIAIDKGGKLQEYVGDGLFISFPSNTPAAAVRSAVSTAIEMQGEYQKILYSWQQYGHPVSHINTHNIGIATGFVYSGFVGHPQNRQEKLIGSTVNLSAHLCNIAKDQGGGIVICQQTAEIIKMGDLEIIPVSSPIGQYYQVVT